MMSPSAWPFFSNHGPKLTQAPCGIAFAQQPVKRCVARLQCAVLAAEREADTLIPLTDGDTSVKLEHPGAARHPHRNARDDG